VQTEAVTSTLAIGEFSRATHLSIKTLRHYHEVGLLEPADIDPQSGYRRYAPTQIGVAQVIRRFRSLDMPIDEIQEVLVAPDVETRNRLISVHLARLEGSLSRTQDAVMSLREILDQPQVALAVAHRRLSDTPAAAITETVDQADALIWYQGALGELQSTVDAQHLHKTGTPGGMFADELFTEGCGEAIIFMPCAPPVRSMGRVAPILVPGTELATVVHLGPHAGIDRAYGTLGAYVARHALSMGGPIREYYLVGPSDTSDGTLWRTEVGWPIFQTRMSP
jgi:DNA-binding transcriptional MerR regulator